MQYLISAQHNGKFLFHMACKEGQFDVVDQLKVFGIILNAQHVNGKTHFNLEYW